MFLFQARPAIQKTNVRLRAIAAGDSLCAKFFKGAAGSKNNNYLGRMRGITRSRI
jgi:hypothetical protein